MGSLSSDYEILETVLRPHTESEGTPLEVRALLPLSTSYHRQWNSRVAVPEKLLPVAGMKKGKSFSPFSLGKKDGSFRLIFKLQKLKKNTQKFHFKMDKTVFVLKLITSNMYLLKLTSRMIIILSQYLRATRNTTSLQIRESCINLLVSQLNTITVQDNSLKH